MVASEVLSARTVEELVTALSSGDSARYLFFWGHHPRVEAVLDHSCLSQWFPVTFTADGETFDSAEHYMMWRKARLFGDEARAAAILAAPSAAEAKALGRQVAGFDDSLWREHRWGIVVDASRAKFASRPGLTDYLRSTRGRVLVEASPLDRIWGIGLAADSPDAGHPTSWAGLNLLGFALMEVRDGLPG